MMLVDYNWKWKFDLLDIEKKRIIWRYLPCEICVHADKLKRKLKPLRFTVTKKLFKNCKLLQSKVLCQDVLVDMSQVKFCIMQR